MALSCNNDNLFHAVFCWEVWCMYVCMMLSCIICPIQPTHLLKNLLQKMKAENKSIFIAGLKEQAMHHRTEWYECLVTLSLCTLPKGRILPWFWTQTYIFPYLTQANGIVKCLGPGVEMYSLLDFLLTLILAGQVVWSCPIPCFICYFSSLKRKSYSFMLRPYSSQAWEVSGNRQQRSALPSECCPESSGHGLGKNNPEPVHSTSMQIPYLIGSPDTVPTISTGS